MAGSYKHLTDDNGAFRFDLIENMGDAHEACQEMWTVINLMEEGLSLKVALDHYYAESPETKSPLPSSELD